MELPPQAARMVVANNPNAVLGACPQQPVVDDSPEPEPSVGAPSVDGVAEGPAPVEEPVPAE